MIETFNELISYLKNPVLEKDDNTSLKYRKRKFIHLLFICIITGSLLMPLFWVLEYAELVNFDNHAMEELLKSFNFPIIFLFAVIVAPALEEILFRAPITLFKQPQTFKSMFYVFAVLFGIVHITNYEISTNVLLFSPILIAPQTILGGYLGFIRVRFGLLWSILLHAFYNATFLLLTFAGELF